MTMTTIDYDRHAVELPGDIITTSYVHWDREKRCHYIMWNGRKYLVEKVKRPNVEFRVIQRETNNERAA